MNEPKKTSWFKWRDYHRKIIWDAWKLGLYETTLFKYPKDKDKDIYPILFDTFIRSVKK